MSISSTLRAHATRRIIVTTPVTFEVFGLDQGPRTPSTEPGKFHYPVIRVNESAHYTAEEAIQAAELAGAFTNVHRINEYGQCTACWSLQPSMGWVLMSDAPGFSDWERREIPHNNF